MVYLFMSRRIGGATATFDTLSGVLELNGELYSFNDMTGAAAEFCRQFGDFDIVPNE